MNLVEDEIKEMVSYCEWKRTDAYTGDMSPLDVFDEMIERLGNLLNTVKQEKFLKNDGSEGDYPEDYEDNPDHQYICRCGDCGEFFFGNKGRVVCKLCRNKNDNN